VTTAEVDEVTVAGRPIAVVTCAMSGIGRALAQSLASSGATVGIVARDEARAEMCEPPLSRRLITRA
jgi:NADP-dependent 3-hydroxy acid dehydrogenase YdfG